MTALQVYTDSGHWGLPACTYTDVNGTTIVMWNLAPGEECPFPQYYSCFTESQCNGGDPRTFSASRCRCVQGTTTQLLQNRAVSDVLTTVEVRFAR